MNVAQYLRIKFLIVLKLVRVSFTTDIEKEATLVFGCVYESNSDRVGVPWRNNGNWMLMPWDVRDLYR